ncbi:alpha/beta hydrolase [Shimazuella sp. AN120528]|uniref:alpha/beta fold hydrolase n=1 Tax=Shimazuella soli TaxID=1892854 RepID=UPI001F0F0D30|nr:alpha/beta hydrolase [Shimazuella soli]MCH5583600.1 alpha/beta hydrolase [Shimazuella soli]
MAKMNQTKGLVFIHGAGLHSSIWSEVSTQMNYPVLQLAFPTKSTKKRTLEDYIYFMQQQVEAWEVEKFVIVAHSIGGLLGLRFANIFQDRAVGFVAIGAAIPQQGSSFLSIFPFAKQLLMKIMLHVFGTRPPKSVIRRGLCNDLTNDQADEIVNSFNPESIHLYIDRLGDSIPDIEKIYVKLMNDQEFPPLLQDQMIANLLPQRIVELETGHLPMVSNPNQLGLIINDFMDTMMKRN